MPKRLNIQETVGVDLNPETITNLTQLQESASKNKELPDKIITVVEGIHSGLTKNYTFYPAQNLEKSVDSWTRPYNKPVIKNHNVYEEPVGRVIAAEFKESQIAAEKHTIQLTLEITDPETIRKVLDGRYQTLSIGGSTKSAVCSVCGKDLVKEGYCGHMKGRTYEGKQAHWIIGEMEFDEISWVNVPADANAQVIQKNTATVTTKESSQEGGEEMSVNASVEEHTQDLLDQIDALRTTESEETTTTETDTTTVVEGQEDTTTTTEGEETTVTTTEETEAPTLEEQLAAANDRIATLEAQVVTLEGEKTTLQDSVDTLTADVATKESRVTELEGDLTVAETENKKLMKQNVELATITHSTLAESVAQLHIVLGKTTEEEVVTLRESLSKESARSLKEKAAGLVKEKPQRTIQHVTLADAGEFAESTSTKKEETKELTIVDLAERMSKVFNKINNN